MKNPIAVLLLLAFSATYVVAEATNGTVPIVLLHGVKDNCARQMDALAEYLSEEMQVYAYC